MTLRYYIGYDPRDTLAFEVCAASCLKHASVAVEIIPLKEWEMRARRIYWRRFRIDEKGQRFDDRDGLPATTEFSYLRFLIPILENYRDDWVLWSDADMLWRADIAELVALIDPDKAVMCVKHDHRPPETVKITGNIQRFYLRKNWSSLMLIKPSANRRLTKYVANNQSKDWLHQLTWLRDEEIGALPEAWNWLAGWSDPGIDPRVVHFTRGTPDIPGYEDEPFADAWRAVLRERGINLAAFPLPAR